MLDGLFVIINEMKMIENKERLIDKHHSDQMNGNVFRFILGIRRIDVDLFDSFHISKDNSSNNNNNNNNKTR